VLDLEFLRFQATFAILQVARRIAESFRASLVTQHFEPRCASLIEAIDHTDDQPLRKASNIHNATAATARRMIKLVLMSRLTLKIQVIGVCRPPS
jgi:hypothetical protein